MTSPRRLALLLLLAAALAAVIGGGYWAWQKESHPRSAPLAAPKEPELALTPQETAELERQLQGLILQVMMKECQIEKIWKDSRGFVMRIRTKDSVMELHLTPSPQQPAQTPAAPGK